MQGDAALGVREMLGKRCERHMPLLLRVHRRAIEVRVADGEPWLERTRAGRGETIPEVDAVEITMRQLARFGLAAGGSPLLERKHGDG